MIRAVFQVCNRLFEVMKPSSNVYLGIGECNSEELSSSNDEDPDFETESSTSSVESSENETFSYSDFLKAPKPKSIASRIHQQRRKYTNLCIGILCYHVTIKTLRFRPAFRR